MAGLALPVDRLHLGAVMLVAIPGTPFWLMCLLVGSVSLLNPVFKASQLALLPDVLPGGRFAVGMAIRNMTVQSAQLLGFAGGGLLVAALNPRAALVIDGLTFLASALLLRAGLRPRPAAAVRDAGGPTGAGWLRSFRRAGGLVVADTGVRTLFLLVWLMAVIAVYEGLAAPYTAALGGGSAAMGLLLAGDPLGGGRRGVRG